MAGLNIQVGAYGWLHAQWQGAFYPDDLPREWSLAYYSNELNTVMVPAGYWHHSTGFDCKNWLDNIHDDFNFYVECPSQTLLDEQAFSVLLQQLNFLKSHLAGVVIGELPVDNGSVNTAFNTMLLDKNNAESQYVEQLQSVSKLTSLYSKNVFQGLTTKPLWSPGWQTDKQHEKPQVAELAIFYDDLTQLRETRVSVEQFVRQFAGLPAADETSRAVPKSTMHESTMPESAVSEPDVQRSIIVRHELLNAENLTKFRSVIEIMGL